MIEPCPEGSEGVLDIDPTNDSCLIFQYALCAKYSVRLYSVRILENFRHSLATCYLM